MIKKIALVLLLHFFCATIVAQDRPALLNKFSKELEKNKSESSYQEAMAALLEQETAKKEKASKKKASKYIKKLKEELSFLEATLKYNNYSLLNELIAGGYFKKIDFGVEHITAGDQINLHIKHSSPLALESILSAFPGIEEKHKITTAQKLSDPKNTDLIAKYATDKDAYASYLLKLIKEMLGDHKKTLSCRFKAYINFEASTQLTAQDQSIALRQHFILFCRKRLE